MIVAKLPLFAGNGWGRLLQNYWALSTLKPFGESVACENLSLQGFSFYSPQIEELSLVRGKKLWKKVQLFPGYMFVFIDDYWKSITGTKGIASLVMAGDLPSRMRDTDILRIKSLEVDGLVLLPKAPRRKGFIRGDRVEAKSGPMAGRVGIYQGDRKSDRIRVLYQMFGRETETYLRESDLIAA